MNDGERFKAQLRDKDDTLRSFFESATVMMGTVEITDDDILHVSDNRATATALRHYPGCHAGQDGAELGVSERYIAMWLGAYRACLDSNEPVRFDYEHEGMGWLAVTVNYIGQNSGGERFSYVVDNISDRKRIERTLQEPRASRAARQGRTAELEALNQQLRHDAFHDALTGLPNRALFVDHLGKAVERAKRRPEVASRCSF